MPFTAPLLGPDDPAPYTVLNENGSSRYLILSDHNSNTVPKQLDNLGLTEEERHMHVAWDIGIAETTSYLSQQLDAVAVCCNYSRLVVDVNRYIDGMDFAPPQNHGVKIPGNHNITTEEYHARVNEIFWPYQNRVAEEIRRFREDRGVDPILLMMHSFTKQLPEREPRPWELGFLMDKDRRLGEYLLQSIRRDHPRIIAGDNQPYVGNFGWTYTQDTHALKTGLAHVTLEFRNDLIETTEGAHQWVEVLLPYLRTALDDADLTGAIPPYYQNTAVNTATARDIGLGLASPQNSTQGRPEGASNDDLSMAAVAG